MHMCIFFFVAVDWKITYFFKFYLRPWIVFIEHRISFQICSLGQISLLILFIVTLNKNFRYKTKYQLPPPPLKLINPPTSHLFSFIHIDVELLHVTQFVHGSQNNVYIRFTTNLSGIKM